MHAPHSSRSISRRDAGPDDTGDILNTRPQSGVRLIDEQDYFRSTPLMGQLANEAADTAHKPFDGKIVVMVLHFLDNLLPFTRLAMAAGLRPESTTLFYKDYPYPHKRHVAATLSAWGFDVRPEVEITAGFFAALREKATDTGLPILVAEDGGYLTPSLLADPNLSGQVIGSVEQTTHGLKLVKEALKTVKLSAPFPVLSLPTCSLKQTFEPPHIAAGVVGAVENLLHYRCLNHMDVAVLGCGAVGSALIKALANRGAAVKFFDPSHRARLNALNLPGKLAKSAVAAVEDADLIFGASGTTSINADVIRAAKKPGVWLISASSRCIEIDVKHLTATASRPPEQILLKEQYDSSLANPKVGTRYYLRPKGQEVNLAADGMPVNFAGLGGMPDQAADLILSLIYIAARELADGRYKGQGGVLSEAIDELADEQSVCEKYLHLVS